MSKILMDHSLYLVRPGEISTMPICLCMIEPKYSLLPFCSIVVMHRSVSVWLVRTNLMMLSVGTSITAPPAKFFSTSSIFLSHSGSFAKMVRATIDLPRVSDSLLFQEGKAAQRSPSSLNLTLSGAPGRSFTTIYFLPFFSPLMTYRVIRKAVVSANTK